MHFFKHYSPKMNPKPFPSLSSNSNSRSYNIIILTGYGSWHMFSALISDWTAVRFQIWSFPCVILIWVIKKQDRLQYETYKSYRYATECLVLNVFKIWKKINLKVTSVFSRVRTSVNLSLVGCDLLSLFRYVYIEKLFAKHPQKQPPKEPFPVG